MSLSPVNKALRCACADQCIAGRPAHCSAMNCLPRNAGRGSHLCPSLRRIYRQQPRANRAGPRESPRSAQKRGLIEEAERCSRRCPRAVEATRRLVDEPISVVVPPRIVAKDSGMRNGRAAARQAEQPSRRHDRQQHDHHGRVVEKGAGGRPAARIIEHNRENFALAADAGGEPGHWREGIGLEQSA
jgi:hypothetical protein